MPVSTFLDGRVPTQLRGLGWLSLSDLGRVLTLAGSDDAGGGITESYSVGSYLPCRVDPVGSQGGEVADRLEERSTHLITLLPQTVVRTKDRFEISGRGTYEITAVRTRTSENFRKLEAVEA